MITIEQEKEIIEKQICPICKAQLNDMLVCTICEKDWHLELCEDYGVPIQ